MAEPTTYEEARHRSITLSQSIRRALNHLLVLQGTVREAQAIAGRGAGGRELALAQTKLDEARLWLGEVTLTEEE